MSNTVYCFKTVFNDCSCMVLGETTVCGKEGPSWAPCNSLWAFDSQKKGELEI